MRKLNFTKAVASGNDFIIVDNRGGQAAEWPSLAKKLCQRKISIGADGLLILEDSKKADVRMRIFNPDGSEAEMCGNGSRCVAYYCKTAHTVETKAGVLEAKLQTANRVKIRMTDPTDLKMKIDINLNGRDYEIHFVNTGVPHAVYFADNLDNLDVTELGRLIRYHDAFRPAGTNADFVEVRDKKTIALRTYERGVEDETLACGTGACAAAIISSFAKGVTPPVDVYTKSGEVLKIYFDKDRDGIKNLYLEGEAEMVFEGTITLSD